MIAVSRVREHVRKFFNPDPMSVDGAGSRNYVSTGKSSLVTMELLAFIYLRLSADVGELPYYITDVLIIGISLLEVLLAPFFCYIGARRRRTVMLCWCFVGFIGASSLYLLPEPDTVADDGLCGADHIFPDRVPTGAMIRLTILIIASLIAGLGKAALLGHSLAFLDEYTPSANLLMDVANLILIRIMIYVIGTMVVDAPDGTTWLQKSFIVVQLPIALIGLYRYPEIAPSVKIVPRDDGGLFESMGRVLGNWVAVLHILAMALLAAGWWGYGMHRAAFVQARFNVKLSEDNSVILGHVVNYLPMIVSAILVGYLYTTPVMPKFDKKAASMNATRCCFRLALLFTLSTAFWGCQHNGVAGVVGDTFVQPTCGQGCGCDRPWMEFEPVCEPEQLTTYFSPCHAGCGSTEVFNNIPVYSNCTCSSTGRVTTGACGDGSCGLSFFMHQSLFVAICASGLLAFLWQMSIVLESVDKRDVAVATGILASVVSLFTFVGAQLGYEMINSKNCIYSIGYKCLIHNESFTQWIGYTSVALSSLSFIVSVIGFLVLTRQEKKKKDDSVQVSAM